MNLWLSWWMLPLVVSLVMWLNVFMPAPNSGAGMFGDSFNVIGRIALAIFVTLVAWLIYFMVN